MVTLIRNINHLILCAKALEQKTLKLDVKIRTSPNYMVLVTNWR